MHWFKFQVLVPVVVVARPRGRRRFAELEPAL